MDINQNVVIHSDPNYAGNGASELSNFFQTALGLTGAQVVFTAGDKDTEGYDPSITYRITYHVDYTLPFGTPGKYSFSRDFTFLLRGSDIGDFKKRVKLIRDQWILDSIQKASASLRDELSAFQNGTGTLPSGMDAITYSILMVASFCERFPTVDNPN